MFRIIYVCFVYFAATAQSSSANCLLHSDVVKGESSPTGRGRRSRDEKGNQGVGDIRFTNILQLFSIYFSQVYQGMAQFLVSTPREDKTVFPSTAVHFHSKSC